MRWFDTHCHLDIEPLANHFPAVLERARKADVHRFLIPAIHGAVTLNCCEASVQRAWGVHPGVAQKYLVEDLEKLWEQRRYKPAAIGETGLDAMAESRLEQQEPLFVWQLQQAEKSRLPVIMHLRGKWDLALRLLKHHAPGVPWVMHNFCGSWETAKLFLREGAFLSFSGSMCRLGARKTPEVARQTPLDRLLLETDSPDLAPPVWKSSENEPASLPLIAQFLSDLRHEPLEKLSDRIWENSRQIFG